MLSPETADIFAVILGLGLLGLIAMTGVSPDWQNVRGWLIVSYICIPLGLVVIAVLVAYPPLLFGALFLLGAAAMGGRRR